MASLGPFGPHAHLPHLTTLDTITQHNFPFKIKNYYFYVYVFLSYEFMCIMCLKEPAEVRFARAACNCLLSLPLPSLKQSLSISYQNLKIMAVLLPHSFECWH